MHFCAIIVQWTTCLDKFWLCCNLGTPLGCLCTWSPQTYRGSRNQSANPRAAVRQRWLCSSPSCCTGSCNRPAISSRQPSREFVQLIVACQVVPCTAWAPEHLVTPEHLEQPEHLVAVLALFRSPVAVALAEGRLREAGALRNWIIDQLQRAV